MVRGLWFVSLCDDCRCLASDEDEVVRGRNRLLSAQVSLFVTAGIMVVGSVICFRFVIVVVVVVAVVVMGDDGADMDFAPLEGLVGVVEEEDCFVDLLNNGCFSFFFFLPRDERFRCCSLSTHDDGFSLPEYLAGFCW